MCVVTQSQSQVQLRHAWWSRWTISMHSSDCMAKVQHARIARQKPSPNTLFQKAVNSKAKLGIDIDDNSAEEKWLVLRSEIIETAKSQLGSYTEQCRHPGGFRESPERWGLRVQYSWVPSRLERDSMGSFEVCRLTHQAARVFWFREKHKESQKFE